MLHRQNYDAVVMSPRADDVADQAKLVDLDAPRPLSQAERDLLLALVAPLGVQELVTQAEGAIATAECSCGCPSIGLRTDGAAVPPATVRQLSDAGRDDVLAVTGSATNAEGREVEITAHVVFGRLTELEIWSGLDGGEVATELPPATSLRRGGVGEAT